MVCKREFATCKLAVSDTVYCAPRDPRSASFCSQDHFSATGLQEQMTPYRPRNMSRHSAEYDPGHADDTRLPLWRLSQLYSAGKAQDVPVRETMKRELQYQEAYIQHSRDDEIGRSLRQLGCNKGCSVHPG